MADGTVCRLMAVSLAFGKRKFAETFRKVCVTLKRQIVLVPAMKEKVSQLS